MSAPPDPAAIERRIRGSLLRLRRDAPFFAALCLFARFRPSAGVPTACTDGRDVFYNPAYLAELSPAQLDAVLLHEVLHAALSHPTRVRARDPVRWNVAADIVVNGIVAAQPGLELPEGALRDPKLEHLSVEEIYALLDRRASNLCPNCLRPGAGGAVAGSSLAEIEAYWRRALLQAEAMARSLGQGTLPAGLERIVREASEPRVDWRTQLWRFLVRTPTDFGAFDRRFLHQRLYLEALEGESLRALVAVDTSGSVNGPLLGTFLGEVRGVLGAYPHVRAELYYADADLYGPYAIDVDTPLPPPKGGGGTRFEPFFERAEREPPGEGETLLIYLTDGYGSFPKDPPLAAVLWVVAPGGAPDSAFPFGSVVRLVDIDEGGG
ncbi:MAG TPA: VWA-like domain-containing protein [Polyangiaceae bacterium]|nr:VWA-like domain-containing protein [Polyangiaceae bacterium]